MCALFVRGEGDLFVAVALNRVVSSSTSALPSRCVTCLGDGATP